MEKKIKDALILAGVGAGMALAAKALFKKKREYDLKDKVVLITGGSRGLGLVMARQFAKQGARLAICARDEAELARARVELETLGAEVLDIVCDVTVQENVNEMVEAVRNRFGRIDVLVNNAGVIQVGPIEVQTLEDFQQAMDVHFFGPLYTMMAVLPEMRERSDGRIVNISSIGGKVSVPHLAPYSASKFALTGLSSAMRVELAKNNVYVTTVCPGLMRTGSHINAVFKGQNKAEFAWFSIGNGLPCTSIKAERAASQIIKACKQGDAELLISMQAQLAVKFQNMFPELTADLMSLVNQILPSAAGGIGTGHAKGIDSESAIAPSILTTLVDKASEKNNELGAALA
jgi:short-subunit dehydrogenase